VGTINVVGHRSAGSYRASTPGTANTVEETYKVWWVPTGTEEFPGIMWLMQAACDNSLDPRVPQVQERAAGCDDNGRFFVVASHDWRLDPAAPYTYTVTVSYTSQQPFYYGDERPWTRITRQSQLRQFKAFRDPYSDSINWYPSDGTETPWPPTEDVGGDRIDICGQPAVVPIPQCSFSIEWHWHRGWTGLSEGGIETPAIEPPGWLAAAAGQRNESKFLGYDKGEVVYLGFSCSPVDPQTYVISYKFLWDYLSHHEQMAAPNIANARWLAPSTIGFIDIAAGQFQQCNKVAWWQPYSGLIDFVDLFPGIVWDALHEAYPPQNSCSTFTGGRPRPILVKPT
jgi:hypothetical protein